MFKQFLSHFAFFKSIICLLIAGIPFIFIFSSDFKIHTLKINSEVFYSILSFWYLIFLIFAVILICYTVGFWKKFVTIILTILSVTAFIFTILGTIFLSLYQPDYIKNCGKYDLIKRNGPGNNGKPTFYFQGKYLDNSVLVSSIRYSEFNEKYVDESNPNSENFLNEFDSNNSGLKNTRELYSNCIR